ncbi:hypothetical protein NA23_03085 [Fervidobacterium islandicum]|uniref:Uncharacterized protein n=1 Tax=Fervidobacterium islandicum TaxID=2423 RepID=A0AAI8GCW3_FERIS|nr:hypothetical protein [Fervidobacterium islandicum]AMW32378.1 hypothetical protein NA23_03085 [Fervidobacterium islandicum]
MAGDKITLRQLETHLFKAADILRGKNVIIYEKSFFFDSTVEYQDNFTKSSGIKKKLSTSGLKFFNDIRFPS